MEQIRYVKIPVAETRTEPGTHVAYGLHVQGPVRSWTVWHRYSDFLTLAYDLSREFPDADPPTALPPKSLTSWFSKIPSLSGVSSSESAGQLEFIEERKRALERYIQSMIMSEDDRWRASMTLQRFLAPSSRGARFLAGKNNGLPNGMSRSESETGSVSSDVGWTTPASWLNDQRDAEQLIRDVRQSIVRRENALARNEVSVSHQSLVQAKSQLADLGRALKLLEQGLETIKPSLTSGELLRRQDILMRMNEEKSNLSRIVLGTGHVSSNSDRTALLGGSSSGNNNTRVIGRAGNGTAGSASGSTYSLPGTTPVYSQGVAQQKQHNLSSNSTSELDTTGKLAGLRQAPRSRRIFGNTNPPQETTETRGLDNQGLLQMQNQRMDEQDQAAADLGQLLRRQREMGMAIGNELDLQNQMLGELDQDIDRTNGKLNSARRQIKRL
ncbi:hypothetical protein IW140_001898 [Coemansia sp. RSA 1813]|nr:hypothetical protein EV178_005066 [Coemansia sp. RSA 1646]KAJ1769919.1 hypothetical protein LPJ74_003640 [Coemansia sp. RSA 1843]KAJ2087257.1 hypothetical protein IW138_005103 [Coemansia sp. RSA 986]KAJ2212082.1 hypothetical protein EV179_004944 [Coemansia sp. RSA 487]KAJ2570944.1 hypothetical protein IW140_001898 [Coemansia sp. RSA 1813]